MVGIKDLLSGASSLVPSFGRQARIGDPKEADRLFDIANAAITGKEGPVELPRNFDGVNQADVSSADYLMRVRAECVDDPSALAEIGWDPVKASAFQLRQVQDELAQDGGGPSSLS